MARNVLNKNTTKKNLLSGGFPLLQFEEEAISKHFFLSVSLALFFRLLLFHLLRLPLSLLLPFLLLLKLLRVHLIPQKHLFISLPEILNGSQSERK